MAVPLPQRNQTTRIPLIGETFVRPNEDVVTSIDQWFINCTFNQRIHPITGEKHITVAKRPGFSSQHPITGASILLAAEVLPLNLANSVGYSLYRQSGTNDIIIAESTTIVDVIAASLSDTSCGSSRIQPIVLSSNQIGILFWVNDNGTLRGFIYNRNTDTTTELTDADFPDATMIGNFVVMNGYVYIMTYDTGSIYNSELNQPTNWLSTSFINTQAQQQGCGIAHYKNKIVAFGTDYIEFFEDVGNPTGSPLRRMDSEAIKGFGIFQTRQGRLNSSFQYYEALDTVFWLNNNETKMGPGVYMLQDFKPVKVSSNSLDRLLGAANMGIAGAFEMYGRKYLLIHNAALVLYVLDIELKIFTRWDSSLDFELDGGGQLAILPASGVKDIQVYGDRGFSDMTIGRSASPVFVDGGAAYTMSIQTAIVDLGTEKRKRLRKLKLIGFDADAASTTSISWSDNDYGLFNTPRTVDFNNQRTYLSNCGMFRRRAFKITNSANTKWEAEAAELDYTEMMS